MSNRSTKFISAVFASLLAGSNFAAVAEDSVKAADECLSGPKGAAPAGHHWYYRIDHANKRQCWYSREETDKTARTAPQDSTSSASSPAASSSAATDPVSPPPSPMVSKSIADARAELPSPQMRVELDTYLNVESRTGGAVAAASPQNSQRATAPDARAPSSSVASRWPDSAGVSPSNDPRLAAAEPPANPATSPQPATTQVAPAAADSPQEKQPASMQMLLLAMAGALALAGVIASLIYRFGRARATQPEIRVDRPAIWDQVRTERSSPSMFPDEDMPIWRANVARDRRAPDDPERRVTEMLARLARSAQT